MNEIFEHIQPGLSSYADPKEAANSLEPLLQAAVHAVPPEYQKCTLITVKATAGLRMLQGNLANMIIEAVRQKIASYPFPTLNGESVSVMEGEQEGLLAWITLNYLLKRIGTDMRMPTAGIMDLGNFN